MEWEDAPSLLLFKDTPDTTTTGDDVAFHTKFVEEFESLHTKTTPNKVYVKWAVCCPYH